MSLFDPATAQQTMGTPGTFSEILAIEDGFGQRKARAPVGQVLPRASRPSPASRSPRRTERHQGRVGFFTTFLLAFTVISLFVGSSSSSTRSSMLVAQRSRELALLRALGASRRQVNGAVILEALVVGVLGSTLGVGLGVLLALGLQGLVGLLIGNVLFGILGFFRANTVLWAYLTGVIVTVVAALAPAAAPPTSPRWPRCATTWPCRPPRSAGGRYSAPWSGPGLASMAAGLVAGAGILWVGVGALGIFLGVAMLSPFLGRPMVGGVGSVLPRFWGWTRVSP